MVANGLQLCKGRVLKALTCQFAINLVKGLNFGKPMNPCFCIGAVMPSVLLVINLKSKI
jgi:hypothetical protein